MNYCDLLSNINKEENEALFQKAYDKWDTDTMWYCVFRCNNNIIKSMYKKRGVIISDEELLEKVTDATIYVMKFILTKGVRPTRLSSYNYLRCLREVNNKKEIEQVRNETHFLYDENGKQLEIGEYYDDYFKEGEEE